MTAAHSKATPESYPGTLDSGRHSRSHYEQSIRHDINTIRSIFSSC